MTVTTPPGTSGPDTPGPDASTVVSRFSLAAIALPSIVTTVALVVQIAILGDLPDQIAIHWGTNGRPNSFASPWWNLALTFVLGYGLPLLLGVTTLPGIRRGGRGPTYRMMGAVSAGITTFVTVLSTWLTLAQRGLTDTNDVRLGLAIPAYSLAIGFAVGALGWFIQPAQESPGTRVSATPIPAADSSHGGAGAGGSWHGVARFATKPLIALSVAAAGLFLVGLGRWLFGNNLVSAAPLTFVGILLAVLIASTSVFNVEINRTGLAVRSILGLPRFRVPIEDIESVELIDIDPMGEFGGFGVRSRRGRRAVVLRRGDALEVTRRSGKRFAVTVEHPQDAVAALRAILDQR